MFAILGVRVILVEKRPRLLEFADSEIVEALSYHLRDHRVTMRLNEEVASVEETPDGGVVANLKSKKRISGDALLYAVGRQGNVDELNLRGRRPGGRQPRPHRGGCRLPHQGPEHLRRGRRDRLPQPGFGFDGAGPHRRGQRLRPEDPVQSGHLSLRHLHHPGDLLHRQDRRAIDRRGRALRSGRGLLPRDRARPDPRRHHRPPEAHLPSRDPRDPGRAHHRRRRLGVAAHRPGGDDPEGHGRLLRGYGFNYPTLAECYKMAAFNGLNKLMQALYGETSHGAQHRHPGDALHLGGSGGRHQARRRADVSRTGPGARRPQVDARRRDHRADPRADRAAARRRAGRLRRRGLPRHHAQRHHRGFAQSAADQRLHIGAPVRGSQGPPASMRRSP